MIKSITPAFVSKSDLRTIDFTVLKNCGQVRPFRGKILKIGRIQPKDMKQNDILMITADHGCDPGFTKTTDHTREYVPLLIYGKEIKRGINLGTRNTFADIEATILDLFGILRLKNGRSFRNNILF